KGLVATACLTAHDRGLFDYDAKLSHYWPELSDAGKREITVRQLMNHRSGLAAFDTPLSIADFQAGQPVIDAMVRQQPLWPPGTRQGYHGVTFGPYVGEIFRRATGMSVGAYFQEHIAAPFGLDVHLGLSPAHHERVATLYPVTPAQRLLKGIPHILKHPASPERRLLRALVDRHSITARAFGSPAELGAKGMHNFNRRIVRELELPWVNGIGTARDIAKMYAILAEGGTLNGQQLLRSETIRPVWARQSFGDDCVIRKLAGWSQGFIKEETHLFSPFTESFGHPGLGGALGFCDPPRRLAWSYVNNALDFRLRSPRALLVSHAIYDSIGVAP
ncbi:MAG: serine hydrolase domain-containing protein, partial [Myxococcota bacterium]|nr:serine hydrolase domain-containing protein [Myxococcota bacterium]